MTLRLATRRSPLALIQSRYVQQRLAAIGVESELVPVETRGDREAGVELASLIGQGAFVVDVQRLVLQGAADVAVHSAKDLSSTTPDGLDLVSVPGATRRRGRPGRTIACGPRTWRDGRHRFTAASRAAARAASGPERGGAAGKHGDATRAAGENGVDAIVAAMAALERLGETDLVAERLDPAWFVPQVGQGALALEARLDDDATIMSLRSINVPTALVALTAERAFLEELGAGCTIPGGAHATCDGSTITLRGVMVAYDGTESVRDELVGKNARELGRDLARRLRDDLGGAALLDAEIL